MNESEYKVVRNAFAAMQPTPRRGVLDEEKKGHVVLLIASGLSRREAAGYVQCAHTTIGRTAARDPDFASKLCQAEATSRVQAVTAIRGAMRDPKYWRAAAWMLERRSPEEYARRDPNSFTADKVMSLLARLYSESLPLLPAEKVGQFQELFDEALDEVEAKSGRTELEDESPDEEDGQRAHLASRNGLSNGNGHAPGGNGKANVQTAAPSGNGNHRPAPAEVVADVCGARSPVPSTQYTAGAASGNGKPRAHVERQEPLAEREENVGPHAVPDEYAATHEKAEVKELPAARRLAGRAAAFGQGVRRFDPAQLHQPLHEGVVKSGDGDDRKSLSDNNLQQESTNCTTGTKLEGRCNNDVIPASPSPA